jgi:hypothetical protein
VPCFQTLCFPLEVQLETRLGLDLPVTFELELPAALDLELGLGLQTASVWDLPQAEIEL